MICPDYLFEVSWEVCNKVGGIYTVLATKSLYLKSQLKRRHILIGPDVWMNTEDNPDFIEDPELYKTWKQQAAAEGLRVRVGKWNVQGRPIAILVDYKQFIPDQNEILTDLWLKYGVDSISGNWDYKESALFGYIAGKVIESFCKWKLTAADRIVAQFHEWQTGSGVLYLKAAGLPVATVFTTHATVVGRCIAGNGLPLYDGMDGYQGDEMARRFNVTAPHSLEKTAAEQADVFTTVSEITAAECARFLGRRPDVVTPNGFENSFTPGTDEEYALRRAAAREKLIEVAAAMSGEPIPGDSVLIGIGGRYEYRNKGIDLFIDALGRLRQEDYRGRPINAFIMIPAGNNGADKNLTAKLSGKGAERYTTQVSHNLMEPEYDRVTGRFRELGLDNAVGSRVKVYFIPSYLNGNDGVFNKKYYDLLVGLDLGLFPSYYEPWGYTPLEALAFRVPTLTTSLSGFGLWVRAHYRKPHPGITVLDRNDSNYEEVLAGVVERIREIADLDKAGRKALMDNAREVAAIALWEQQIRYYGEACSLALEKTLKAGGRFPEIMEDRRVRYEKIAVNTPSWTSVMVTRGLPEQLAGLETLAKNLWWCWNDRAKALFKAIDPEIWHNSSHNPTEVLDRVSFKKFNALAQDAGFLALLDEVTGEFNAYMAAKAERTEPMIAYFCMEYGLDTSLKIYSGGLGILAGDYLKETSDMNVNLVAVGFLYRYGYFNQVLSAQGAQVADYEAQDFMRLPVTPVLDGRGNWQTTSVAFPGRNITARIWKVAVGRTDLYLLDTDYEANIPEDRQVTHHLYGGDWENRLKQELLLGVGGIRALRKLGLEPRIYHCNEGHAAFTGIERLREYVQNEDLSFTEAMEVVRASSLFTTHTPVPAGHDAFDEGLLRKYLGSIPEKLKIDWETLMGLGKLNGRDVHEKFSMSLLAATLSQNVNGVSRLHGEVSREIFSPLYPGYLPEELHISYVTNGVHYPTWTAQDWKEIHAKVFGPEFPTHHYDPKCFEGIYKVPDETVWQTRKSLKKLLFKIINERLSNPRLGSHYSPSQIVQIKETLRSDVLTIGFARRFATYKRATLLFSDLDKLDELVNDPRMPVQFVFAGKAHPADKAGQDLIKKIVDISKQDRFLGKIVFVPGYDISLAKRMVQGVDVWMNNPTRPQEASGTSGEKASMNGVMHFSVLDGWWVEGYRPDAGWALPQEKTYDDQNYQDELDAATIYAIIENEIAPLYYETDAQTGLPVGWIRRVKNTVARVACRFTTHRMLTDYTERYYRPQYERYLRLVADDFREAREIAAWKRNVEREWPSIEVVSYTRPDASYRLTTGNRLNLEVVLNIGGLQPEDVGVELLFAVQDSKGKLHIQDRCEFEVAECREGTATYRAAVVPERTGMYQLATRIYAKNPKLPHRQDFGLVRWL